jgi:hypothetical protein
VSQFEFVTVAASLVMALAIGRLVYALPFVLNPRRFDWLHAVYSISLVLFSFQIWWRSWGYVNVESWTLLKMIVLILPNILVYLSALFLVGETPAKVRSWAAFLDSSGQAMFGAFFATMLAILLRNYYLDGALPGIPGIAASLVSFVGMLWRNRAVWWVIVFLINASFIAVIVREL